MSKCWCSNCGKKRESAGLAATDLLLLTPKGVGIVRTGMVVCILCAVYSYAWRAKCQS